MEWFRAHPYTAALGASAFLVVVGIITVSSRTGPMPVQAPRVWGGGTQPLFDPLRTSNPVLEAQYRFDATNTPFSLYTSTNTGTEPAFDFDALIAGLSKPRGTVGTTSSGVELAYAFIPGGLIATSAPQTAKSELQITLFNYGNEAGSYIQSYEDLNRNAPVVLRNQAEDRRNEQKREAVRQVGRSLANVGRNLKAMEDVPATARPAHGALAESYIEAGGKLEKITVAESDEAFIAAITDYNASVEVFIKRYVALARLFSIHAVAFAPHESGSVFTFTNAQF
ncbi:MAG TPA: hypothetical protein VJH91_00660 [Candidatus Paceibacterota bacterium]